MEKIAVIGLGIIGGSLCGALTNAGYTVDGMDLDETAVEYARQKGYIQAKARDISLYDTVFIAVPPYAAISLLKTLPFKDNAFVYDVCGVKLALEKAVYEEKRNYRYVGLHPMAGKETSGIASATSTLFQRANLVITCCEKTDKTALSKAKEYARQMGFAKIVECSAEEHDRKIALTSQLAHLVSNAYVKSAQVKGCDGFTGGSFQDMTRIAGVDENIWTELYMSNRAYILEELDGLIMHLSEYRASLKNNDEESLREQLKAGRLIRESIKREND